MSAKKSRKRKYSNDERSGPEDEAAEEVAWSDEEGTYVDGIYIPPPAKQITSPNSTRRLIITKITNNFFKSYAKDVVLGPFSKCFNAIVGPNGSGKSNVIDSMLFVFGYRATKIRSKKISVLIHNSEKNRNVQTCTVSVHFCEIIDKPEKGYEMVPGSEFVVSRTASKDNSSFYELDNKRVQFKEVAKLLRKHGIDLDHNRFLILQGEVEEIAMMKCKGANENETGMLEYLEDIIGTNRYKKPLVELTERIENLSVLRSEKLNRLKLIEKELEELKAPMEEAVGFLKMENKVVTCKNFLYQKYIYDLEEKVKTTEEDKRQITESRDELINRLKTLAQEKSEKEKSLKHEAAKYETLTKTRDKLKEAFNNADKKDVQLQAEMTQTNTNRKKFKTQLEEEKKKLAQLERVPEESKKYDLADSELSIANSHEESEKNKLEKLKESVQNAEVTITQRTEEVSQLKRKIPLTEKSLNDTLRELQAVRDEEVQINNEIKQKRMRLEETRSSMQMSRSRGRILDSLMQQKREGNCPGLFGRLGDLGAIDQKYDVAISTACGPLDNIVVDTVSTAQWCIEFLKKHGIGRATFIALDKQEHFRELVNTKIKTPENVHRLFDLIQVQDEIVKTAFYFGLRDTLVANDLDQATRIAYGARRYRVVTLKGDLIETSGTMSGGGKTVSRGRMGQSVVTTNVNPQEIEKMESNLKKCEDRLRDLLQKQTTLENQINTLQPELNQMKINFEKFSKDLQSLKEELPLLNKQLRQQENIVKSTKADPKHIQKLTAVLNTKKEEFEEASAAAQEVQIDVDKLTKEIKDKTSGKMSSVDRSLNEVIKTIDKCKTEITKLRVAVTTSERNAKKSAQKIETLEQSIVDAENRLRQMKSERDTIEVDAQKLLKHIEEIAEQFSSAEEQYA
ncbi:structural maintenance of chromosomes protein 4, partial [Asbolus verrucosus]